MTEKLPTQQENPEGFHIRYKITKADGSPCDPDAVYLVLRIDKGGDDPQWIMVCRDAAAYLASCLCGGTMAKFRRIGLDLLTFLNRTET